MSDGIDGSDDSLCQLVECTRESASPVNSQMRKLLYQQLEKLQWPKLFVWPMVMVPRSRQSNAGNVVMPACRHSSCCSQPWQPLGRDFLTQEIDFDGPWGNSNRRPIPAPDYLSRPCGIGALSCQRPQKHTRNPPDSLPPVPIMADPAAKGWRASQGP